MGRALLVYLQFTDSGDSTAGLISVNKERREERTLPARTRKIIVAYGPCYLWAFWEATAGVANGKTKTKTKIKKRAAT